VRSYLKLSDLDPREIVLPVENDDPESVLGKTAQWDVLVGAHVSHPDQRTGVGVTLLCPHCVRDGVEAPRVALYVSNPSDGKGLWMQYGERWTEEEEGEVVEGLKCFLWYRSGSSFRDLTLLPNEKFWSNRGYFRRHVTWVIINGFVNFLEPRWTSAQDYLSPELEPDWRTP
jgi:hypothetical protein